MDFLSVQTSPMQTPKDRLKRLNELACDVELIPGLSIHSYLRVIHSMIPTIDTHIKENHKEAAFVLATKVLYLFIKILPKHKEFGQIGDQDMIRWKDRCRMMLEKAEKLKADLLERFTVEYDEHIRMQNEAAHTLNDHIEPDLDQLLPDPPRFSPPIADQHSASVDCSPIPTRPVSYPTLPAFPDANGPNAYNKSCMSVPPRVDRSLKPQTSNVYGWLPVRVPSRLTDCFMQLAEMNTRSNRETCATLCGKLTGNEYQITDLIVTKQSGTSDSCTTSSEEELFDYMEPRNLIVLGWIHTHPSQTAFLSSVDQHTQLSYQIMLPEAIAIVCAPKFNEIKKFSLNPVHGLPFVRQCKESGFHPHPNTVCIYEDSPHIKEDPNLVFSVVDLR